MLLSNKNWTFGLLIVLLLNGFAVKAKSQNDWETYIITSTENNSSEYWANYIFQQLSKHAKTNGLVKLEQNLKLKKTPSNHKVIYIHASESLKYDYCVERNQNILKLQIRDDKKGERKILDQLIEKIIHQDTRFNSADLPLNTLEFKEGCHHFDFIYREPFFAPNLIPGNAELFATNSIDIDWGIWGHNLKKLVVNKDNNSVYALVDGERNKAQLCFSSTELFNNITSHILDNFGDGDEQAYQFMIAPQDNSLVCQDPACLHLGNTHSNATPAVASLIKKLAHRFPKHQFFTIAYRTTLAAPKEELPTNAGVFLSTIDLPKGIKLNENQPKTQTFLKLLTDWKAKTPTIYIWDYASNFDDYFTPIPVLFALQHQLQFFKNHNIKGVFLNASGYDYSSFDGLKTYVAASLMIDSQQSAEALIQRYFKHYYPKNNQLLTEYYLKLEHDFAEKLKEYPLYGGAKEILKTYLNETDFIQFYNNLEHALSTTQGIENQRLHKLFTALSFTRLQIAYQNGANIHGFAQKENKTLKVKPEVKKWIANLKQYTTYKNLKQYRESSGDIAEYIQNWENVCDENEFTNMLLDIPLTVLSEPDDGFETPHLLNNGIRGFAPDYHQGWYISSKDLKIGFSLPETDGEKEVKIRFLNDQIHAFYPPELVVVKANGQLIKTITAAELKTEGHIGQCSFNINLQEEAQMEFHFIRKEGLNIKIACDEIQIIQIKK